MTGQDTTHRRAHSVAAASLRHWLSKRFVFLAETVGYGLSAIIGISLIYTLFVRVDVTVPVEGIVRPAAESIRTGQAAYIAEYLVENWAEVSEGTALCRVFLDPSDMAREQARHGLSGAIALLVNDPAMGDAKRLMEEGLSRFPQPNNPVEMLSPSAGKLRITTLGATGNVVPAGQELAQVYSANTLVFEGTIPDGGGEPAVSAGQIARIKIAGTTQHMRAKVEAVVRHDEGMSVRISVTPVPTLVSAHFYSMLAEGDEWTTANAEVITSKISLFRSIFGRQ